MNKPYSLFKGAAYVDPDLAPRLTELGLRPVMVPLGRIINIGGFSLKIPNVLNFLRGQVCAIDSSVTPPQVLIERILPGQLAKKPGEHIVSELTYFDQGDGFCAKALGRFMATERAYPRVPDLAS